MIARFVPLLFLCAGCLGQGGSVMLTASMQMGVSPTVTGFSASNATGVTDDANVIHFTATSTDGELTLLIQGPIKQGDMVDLTVSHNNLSYDQTGAGWSSNGGSIAVDAVSPYKLRFLAVPMLPGSGTAKGQFVLSGSGTFD
jgi:hypothetical protein